MAKKIQTHNDLDVYKIAMEMTMEVFKVSKHFPKEETYSLTDQIRRSSRSVCANIAEAWRKRRYELAFASKLCDAEAEAAETQVWLECAVKCGYVERREGARLYADYNRVLGKIVTMIARADQWVLPKQSSK